jgi:hypothetical protein
MSRARGVSCSGSMPMLRIRKSFHSSVAKASRPLIERRQHLALGQLDLAQRVDAERAAVLLLSDGRVVGKFHLGIEAAGQHAFVAVDHRLADAHVLQLQARQAWPRRNRSRHPVGR